MATTTHWRPKRVGAGIDQVWILDRRGVDRDLVGAGGEELAHVAHRAHAAADRQRDEDLVGGALDDVDHRAAAVGRRRDVEEDELVGALAVVERGQLDRIAGVAQIDELDALDDAAAGHVEAGNDAPVWSGAGRPLPMAARRWLIVGTRRGAPARWPRRDRRVRRRARGRRSSRRRRQLAVGRDVVE